MKTKTRFKKGDLVFLGEDYYGIFIKYCDESMLKKNNKNHFLLMEIFYENKIHLMYTNEFTQKLNYKLTTTKVDNDSKI